MIFGLQASDVEVYTITIDVESTKTNGKPWDFSGGSPDIELHIDGKRFPIQLHCRNCYRCSMNFYVENDKDEWYFEIYDKDFSNDDLIGKGNCSDDDSCKLGRATITIKEK
jgi:hypothetical protein